MSTWKTAVDQAGAQANTMPGATFQSVYNAMLAAATSQGVSKAMLDQHIIETQPEIARAQSQAQYQTQYSQATPDGKQQMDRQAFTQWWHNLLSQKLTQNDKQWRMIEVNRAAADNNLRGQGVSDDEIAAYLLSAHRNLMEETLSTDSTERQALYLNTKYNMMVVPPRNPPYPLPANVRADAIAEANAARAAAGMPPSPGPPAGSARRSKKTKKRAMKKRKSRRNNKKTYRRPLFSY